jgi:tetratricopeptide (TPR) repeat protein
MQRAFAQSAPLSEPERLFIRSSYHYIVTGRLDEVVGTYRLWIETYPQDWIPHSNLSAALFRLNRLDEALDEARTAVKLGPDQIVPYQQLANVLLALDQFAECKEVLRKAADRKLDSSFSRALLFDLAFIDGDAASMQEHLLASARRVDGFLVIAEAARAAGASGQIETRRTLYAQAVTGALSEHSDDFAGALLAEEALADALEGNRESARVEIKKALAISTGAETSWHASLAAALTGDTAQAAQLATEYERRTPPAVDVLSAFRPGLQAAIAMANGDARTAVTLLNGGVPYERVAGPWLPYLRGTAYESLQDHRNAAAQFRAVVAHRGSQPADLLHSLGRLQLARALKAEGDLAGAREAYRQFAAAWRDSDPRQGLLLAAAREALSVSDATPPR